MILGMDTEAVAALAGQLADVAERVRGIEQRLTSGLAATEWVGNDRQRFDAEWGSQHVVALRQAAEALDDASRVAADEVRQQESASR
ncbi:hypothetical protein GCM10023340_39770 [Nocardioides marinquilinus]|uniref:WXG100 family type VII secretion target n=1 Tax=Nocardioides marinquilinus TaxID=1210400 RepID=A0ABP9Q0B5_9ACTN